MSKDGKTGGPGRNGDPGLGRWRQELGDGDRKYGRWGLKKMSNRHEEDGARNGVLETRIRGR